MKQVILRDGKESNLDSFTAIGLAEGFIDPTGFDDVPVAWSFIAVNKLYKGLQGWFGRNIKSLLKIGLLKPDGQVNWDEI
jgi:hypothetical protein